MANLEIRVHRASRVFRDLWDPQDPPGEWVNLARMATLVNQDPQDPAVTQERTVIKVLSVRPVPQAVQEREDLRVPLVLGASKVSLACQVSRVPVARTESLAYRVRGVLLAVWVCGASEGSRESVGLRVLLENPANVEREDGQALMAPQVLPAPLDRKDILDLPVLWGCQEVVAPMACREGKVNVALLDPLEEKVLQVARVTRVLRE
ncbi:hypothetical protein GWK47_017885 [Chionoecetes opilio]|uniref:Uncharacterized protein n=1 Tax=Chionoecetes opilio TaxID=41210 RepID=A0A8J4XRJ5_CHIOP|nr:hypothetical protein GWK47_017885 [Chionoecetes opilio]